MTVRSVRLRADRHGPAKAGHYVRETSSTRYRRIRMIRAFPLLASALLVLALASTASAQLAAAKDGPIVYGHHHLNTANMEAQKKFFVDTLGGKLIKIGTNN